MLLDQVADHLTPLQRCWIGFLLVADGAKGLPPEHFETFLSMLTIWVAEEKVRAVKQWL